MGEIHTLDLQEIDATQGALVGGKGANLGELTRIAGIRVPDGFCVTTAAFRRAMARMPEGGDRAEAIAIPADVELAIGRALERFGDQGAYAVRSSATAEDSPSASFAGQHDTFLGLVGRAAILRAVGRCWASLFTERAVSYRLRNGIDDRDVEMAVVVQRMVAPHASGVLFTADPATGNRRIATVDAVAGLGEDLVSGRVNPDTHRVRDDAVVASTTAGAQPALTDEQVVALAQLGRRLEAHFGRPQDIEWCLADDGFAIVQSRPITTLFPVPVVDDADPHVYVSVGHQQMMTDPFRALGLSLFQLTALPVMHEAGGRLFVDVAPRLASPANRAAVLDVLGRSDPLIGDALQTILDRDGFITPTTDEEAAVEPLRSAVPVEPPESDPAIVAELIAAREQSIATLKQEIATRSGSALFDFVLADIAELKRLLFEPRSSQLIMAGMQATWWLNDQLEVWLGEKNAADTLAQSAPGNVTSEMGLALLDVADAIRPHPQVVGFLERLGDEDLLDGLDGLDGGSQPRAAIEAFLDRYGMRCVGEIDITRPRWSERPATLVPVLLGNVRSFEPGAGRRRFEQGRRQAEEKERELLGRLRALPDGAAKAEEAERVIARIRAFIGYREYPKYFIVSRYLVYKQALLAEAQRLVDTGALARAEDAFDLTFQELHEAVRSGEVDPALIAARRQAFRSNAALTPPRVITSEGEVVAGAYRRDDAPAGALLGLAVSAGTVEGRARVVLDIAHAELEPGDILVTAYTDPSWTPAFVAIDGLVTEVGGLMTHGAVIAREYGLPAVVGVQDATRLIRDGQRIRVHGTEGYVELLS